ncbi:hypothetical protein LPJ66_004152 [Kickxella alabastrina]|uniref:Uncharacterized protein n=1 Tax=Kickxella alabastrina TaxID=61397 RepID=A0ACC1IM77_9FUNG|nr:hypothetical protein LPJ66_004152 [Kickxella alabastrina]
MKFLFTKANTATPGGGRLLLLQTLRTSTGASTSASASTSTPARPQAQVQVQPLRAPSSPPPTTFELLARLDRSVHCQNIQETWYWYRRLLNRRKREPTFPPIRSTSSGGIVPRAQANSTQPVDIHSKVLSILSTRKMHGYTERHLTELTEMIKAVLGHLAAEHRQLTPHQLTQLLGVFATAKRGEAADHLWQYAALSGMARDIACYNAYVNAKIEAGQYERAFEVLREVREGHGGVQPNTYTRTCLIRLYGLTGDLAAAQRTFAFVLGQSTGPAAAAANGADYVAAVDDRGMCAANAHVYTAMMHVLGMNGQLAEMQRLFLQMTGLPETQNLGELTRRTAGLAQRTQGSLWPRRQTLHALVQWHARYWDLRGALQWVALMYEVFGIRPVPKTFKLALTPENCLRDLETCAEVVLEMEHRWGVRPPRSVVEAVERAARKVEEMKEMIRSAEAQSSTLFPGSAV